MNGLHAARHSVLLNVFVVIDVVGSCLTDVTMIGSPFTKLPSPMKMITQMRVGQPMPVDRSLDR